MLPRRLPWQLILVLLLVIVMFGNANGRASETAAGGGSPPEGCTLIRSPTSNWTKNTALIQGALNAAASTFSPVSSVRHPSGCVSVGGGDYPLANRLRVGSNTLFRIEADARLVNVINVTKTALVLVDSATNVTLAGGGMLYGSAEKDWNWFSKVDNRMSPDAADGSNGRINLLLITKSTGVLVRDLHFHNSTDWSFRMDSSENIHVDNVDIYGDSRFPNNDGFDPESCINVTLVNSRISVADDGICPKASLSGGPLRGLYVVTSSD
jgi:polygalacturonase